MLRILTIFFVFFTVFPVPETSWACSCATPVTPKAGLESSKAVFLATVDSIEQDKNKYISSYNFKIDKVWKGAVGKKLTHTSGNSMCDYRQFKTGESYLIYADKPWDGNNPNKYTLTFCSRTKEATDAGIEMRYLDALDKGVPVATIDDDLVPILRSSKNPKEIIEALRFLVVSIRSISPAKETLQAIIALIRHSSLDVRRAVAVTLGNYTLAGNQQVIDALNILLRDDHTDVRMSAVFSLRMVGRRTEQVYLSLRKAFLREVERFKNYAEESSQNNISIFLEALAETVPKNKQLDVLDTLIEYIPQLDGYAKVSSIQRIGFMQEKAVKAVPLLLEELKKSTSEAFGIRQYTIMALGSIGEKEAIFTIASYSKDDNCYVTKEVAVSLHKIGGEDAVIILKSKVIPELISRFDRCSHQFAQAFTELGKLSLPALPMLIEKYQSSGTQDWVKGYLKTALQAIGTNEALAVLKP